MIGQVIAFMAVAQGAAAPADAPPSAAKLISSMFAKYSQAQTLVGKVTLTQAVGGQSGQIVTEIQYERPAKLYIRQTKLIGETKKWTLSATGKAFSYDEPARQVNASGARLAESQIIDERVIPIDEVFMIASGGLGDASVPLDIAVGVRSRLASDRSKWVSFTVKEKVKIGEVEAHRIEGRWRPGRYAAVCGSFEMCITEQGDLLRYGVTQDLASERGAPAQRLVSTWDCDLKVGAKPDEAVFKVYR